MADSLITAHARDVDIKVIIEGGPVGGISPEGKEAMRMLTRGGIPVSMMVSRTENLPLTAMITQNIW